jgi:predicted nucleic acid-binding protein
MVAAIAMPRPQIALDTNVLLDYADDKGVVVECFSAIRKYCPDSQIFVLPTVIDELNKHSKRPGPEGQLGIKALKSILSWGFKPISVVPVGNGIVEETARKIRFAGLLPDKEINDSYIIAEAALANVAILISSDSHLKDINHQELKELLDGCDLANTTIVPPWAFAKAFERKA